MEGKHKRIGWRNCTLHTWGVKIREGDRVPKREERGARERRGRERRDAAAVKKTREGEKRREEGEKVVFFLAPPLYLSRPSTCPLT